MKDYYTYPKDSPARWLDGDNPNTIGGRSTDIEQIGYSLRCRLKEAYEINAVPSELVTEANALVEILKHGDFLIQRFIKMVAADLDKACP
jgi:hypothetical protein